MNSFAVSMCGKGLLQAVLLGFIDAFRSLFLLKFKNSNLRISL